MNVRLFLDIINELDKFNMTMVEWDRIDTVKEKIVTLIEGQEETIKNLQKELKLKKFQEEIHVETILQLKDEKEKLFNEKEKIRDEFKELNRTVCKIEEQEGKTIKQILFTNNEINKNNTKVNPNSYAMFGITAEPITIKQDEKHNKYIDALRKISKYNNVTEVDCNKIISIKDIARKALDEGVD